MSSRKRGTKKSTFSFDADRDHNVAERERMARELSDWLLEYSWDREEALVLDWFDSGELCQMTSVCMETERQPWTMRALNWAKGITQR